MYQLSQVGLNALETKRAFIQVCMHASKQAENFTGIYHTSNLLFGAVNYLEAVVNEHNLAEAVELFVKHDFEAIQPLSEFQVNTEYLTIVHKAVSASEGLFDTLKFETKHDSVVSSDREAYKDILKAILSDDRKRLADFKSLDKSVLKQRNDTVDSIAAYLKANADKSAIPNVEIALAELMELIVVKETNKWYHSVLEQAIQYDFSGIYSVARKQDIHSCRYLSESFYHAVNASLIIGNCK
ncbi:hypothetical protein LMH73_016890 [Vibrio splendidus]|nr:hypothetical protein [Vibrio splendidus]MCC4881834.1 hypothetical protein [Vibrio splendidus]